MLKTSSFFDLTDSEHKDLFKDEPVWSGLSRLKEYMDAHKYPSIKSTYLPENMPLPETVVFHEGHIVHCHDLDVSYGDTTKGNLVVKRGNKVLEGATVIMAGAILVGNQVDLGNGVLIESGAMVKSPAIIGDQSEVRHGAYMRGYTLIGKHCVVGHTTEVKHAIFMDHAKAGHFAYLGDSILGKDVNLGAGTKFANLRFLAGNVKIRTDDGLIDSGRKKFGAILGDQAQTGCNSVTNPGTLLGKGSILLPNTTAPSGYHPDQSVIR